MNAADDLAELLLEAGADLSVAHSIAKTARQMVKHEREEDRDILARLDAIEKIMARVEKILQHIILHMGPDASTDERRSVVVTVNERDENQMIKQVTIQ